MNILYIDTYIYISLIVFIHTYLIPFVYTYKTQREREGGRGANTTIDPTINTKVAVDFPFSFEQTIEIQIETNRWIKWTCRVFKTVVTQNKPVNFPFFHFLRISVMCSWNCWLVFPNLLELCTLKQSKTLAYQIYGWGKPMISHVFRKNIPLFAGEDRNPSTI